MTEHRTTGWHREELRSARVDISSEKVEIWGKLLAEWGVEGELLQGLLIGGGGIHQEF